MYIGAAGERMSAVRRRTKGEVNKIDWRALNALRGEIDNEGSDVWLYEDERRSGDEVGSGGDVGDE